MAETLIDVEVAYARPDRQVIIPLRQVPAGLTAAEAIERSGILQQFPEIDLTEQKIGIFSKVCGLDQVLEHGDRVEIYRPLRADPKDARRQRAVGGRDMAVDRND